MQNQKVGSLVIIGWEDYIGEVIYHLAKYNETAEGYANSIEELVDEILGANL